MTKGLVRANNLADLSSKQDSIVNLGLAIADYDSLKSLYTTAGLDFSVVGGIASSTGNYQAQIDGISSTLSGIVLSGFVNRQGNGLISTSWTNSDGIISISGVLSGYSPSSGTTFALSIEQGEAVITTSGLSANDLAYNSFRQANSTVVRASPPSGFNTLQLIPLQVGGQSFFVQASETPSFHIAPAQMRHALDLVTGNLLGTYNSASPAMAVGPDGILYLPTANAPVIEYDPVTGACLGARIWGAVTNLFLQSNLIGVSPWGTNNAGSVTYTSNAALSPAGAVNARRITATADFAGPNQFASVTSGTTYTTSFFVKAVTSGSLDELRLELFGYQLRFKISTQAFSQVNANFMAYGAINYGNGWYRLYASAAAPSTGSVASSLYAYQSTDWYAWGAQLNAGPLAPYVPTTTLAASSTADVWTITGADFSRIINQAEGTIYIEYGPHDATTPASNNSLFTITNSTISTANIIESFVGSNVTPVVRVESNGVNQAYIASSAYSPSVIHKLAAAYKVDDFVRSLDTQSIGTDTSGALPAVAPSILEIGTRNFGGVKPLNGYIREFAVLRSRRPNANLQAMTP